MKESNDKNKESTLGQGAILFTAPTTRAGLCSGIAIKSCIITHQRKGKGYQNCFGCSFGRHRVWGLRLREILEKGVE